MNFEKIGTQILQGIGLALVFLAPLQGVLLAILFLIIIDTVTGIWAAIKNKELFTSKRLRDVIGKISGYLLAVIASHIFQETFGLDYVSLTKIVGFIIGFIEVKSVLENVSKIVGWSLWLKIKSVLSGKKTLKDIIGDETNDEKDNK